ncbi:MAG: XylR family transcriptional regulator [Planctomycetota bacterium]
MAHEGTSNQTKRVLLWIESSRAYGRGCLLGVAAYCSAHTRWQLFHVEHHLEEAVPTDLAATGFDGVIARTENKAISDALHSLNVPIVDLRGSFPPKHGRMIDTSPTACAELAFEHFWERGITAMAFCGYESVDFSERQRKAFVEHAATRDIAVDVFESDARSSDARIRASTLVSEARGEFDRTRMIEWLRGLPKPAAVLAANDVRGRQVLAACAEADIAVPEEIAVLGIDNDEVICELSHPPLSSIEPDTRSIGFAGAASLDTLMSEPSRVNASSVRMIQPLGVTVRQSTDITAIDDLVVARAAKMIREQAESISSVEVLADMVGLSRATLERRFRSALGRSPHQEIDRIRLDRARSLVRGTTYPLHKIADMVGYSNASRLVDAYKRRFKITPGTDRQQSDDPFRDLAC